MKREIIILIIVPVLLLAVIAIQAFRVKSALMAQEELIKEAMRSAPSGTIQSNAPNGAQRFIETGELVFELSYLRNPNLVKQLELLHMRIYPRVTTQRNDGWVGMYNGNWYVKYHKGHNKCIHPIACSAALRVMLNVLYG